MIDPPARTQEIFDTRVARRAARFNVLLTTYECMMGAKDKPRPASRLPLTASRQYLNNILTVSWPYLDLRNKLSLLTTYACMVMGAKDTPRPAAAPTDRILTLS